MNLNLDIKITGKERPGNKTDRGSNRVYFTLNGDELSLDIVYLENLQINGWRLETIEKGDNIDINNLPEDIYLKIHYMSRNEMIRYILKINEINKKMVNADILPFLVRYYKLDIGSDYIYDLTLY